jgi:hypothetical protein
VPRRGRAKLTGVVYVNCCAHDPCSADTGDEGPCVEPIADADGVVLVRRTPFAADIDVVIARAEAVARGLAQRDIVGASYVAVERGNTNRDVPLAG